MTNPTSPLTREDILMSLSMIRRMTRLRDRLSALSLLDELIEALEVDEAEEQRHEAKQYGVNCCH